MAKAIQVTFTDAEIERIDLLIVRSQNNGVVHSFDTDSEIVRRATLAYVDFWERMMAGELDGHPSVRLLIESIDDLDIRILESSRP